MTAALPATGASQPQWTEEQYAAARIGYEIGYAHALMLAAERVDELDAVWRPVKRRSYEEQVAARIAEMQRYAAMAAERSGRPRRCYEGGPVDWETGRPTNGCGVAA